jgi:hypothetical protein
VRPGVGVNYPISLSPSHIRLFLHRDQLPLPPHHCITVADIEAPIHAAAIHWPRIHAIEPEQGRHVPVLIEVAQLVPRIFCVAPFGEFVDEWAVPGAVEGLDEGGGLGGGEGHGGVEFGAAADGFPPLGGVLVCGGEELGIWELSTIRLEWESCGSSGRLWE